MARYPSLLINLPTCSVLDLGQERTSTVSLEYVQSSRPETVCELVFNGEDHGTQRSY